MDIFIIVILSLFVISILFCLYKYKQNNIEIKNDLEELKSEIHKDYDDIIKELEKLKTDIHNEIHNK